MSRDALTDTVLVELPLQADAEQLAERLRPRWVEWVEPDEEVWVVGVELRTARADLAVLLRELEAWVAERRLYAVRYHVDGRSYVLAAGELDLAVAA